MISPVYSETQFVLLLIVMMAKGSASSLRAFWPEGRAYASEKTME